MNALLSVKYNLFLYFTLSLGIEFLINSPIYRDGFKRRSLRGKH